MKNTTKMKVTATTTREEILGLDIGDKRTHFAVLGADGELVEQGIVATSPETFKQTFGRFSEAVITLEVGPHSRWASQLLSDLGHLVAKKLSETWI